MWLLKCLIWLIAGGALLAGCMHLVLRGDPVRCLFLEGGALLTKQEVFRGNPALFDWW